MANTDLVGANGSITWTAGLTDGTQAPAAARAVVVRSNIFRRTSVSTRPGSLMQRLAVGELQGTVGIRVVVTDDGTPPVPIATVGTLKIGLDAAPSAPTKHYVFKVIITGIGNIGYSSLDGHQVQMQDYSCSLCSTATTDTVTAT